MAAILCDSISKMCTALGKGLGQVLCLPCRMCGCACDIFTDICQSDFCLYLTVTLGLNIPPIALAFLSSQANAVNDSKCNGYLTKWMLINACFCASNVVAAFYISNRIRAVREEQGEASSDDVEAANYKKTGNDGSSSWFVKPTTTHQGSVSRVKEVLCYDPAVALYIIALLLYSVWQTIGISRISSVGGGDFGDCDAGIRKHTVDSVVCGFFFLGLGGSALLMSLCCVTSRGNFR